ncbi:MAG: OBAP family protein [Pseudomonadota bacterium]|nr:OBAP family protein [Pseudomonadota bacterium]
MRYAILLSCLLVACKGSETHSPVATQGAPATAKTVALEKGEALLQSKPPIAAINSYFDGFHFYHGNINAQMEAHHYCTILSDDMIQCVIYDGNVADAKLMGVEYIVSAKLFATLPAEEKPLWHSHVHEVKSGQLIAPGLPDVAEKALMTKLVGTYGKTWHTWHTDQHKSLPLGVPQLMMGFTADGQADPKMVEERDARFKVSSLEKRRQRADIPAPAIDPDADGGQNGHAMQVPKE